MGQGRNVKVYWDIELDLRNTKVRFRYYDGEKKNPCHAMIREVRKRRKGDEFYLGAGGKIVRHRIDVVGTWKTKRFPKMKAGE